MCLASASWSLAMTACAERNGGLVLTLDLRHFSLVGREGTIKVLPA